MKLNINTQTGYYAEKSNINEVKVEGVLLNEYPFNERWDDLYAQIEEGSGNGSLTYEAYRDTGYFMRFFRHNQDDVIFMKWQMPHTWDPTTSVRPHMHCVPMASGTGDVKLTFIYTWCPVGQVIPASTGWITGSVLFGISASQQYKHIVASRGLISPPTGSHESLVLLAKFERPAGSDSADTYTTNKDHGTAAANLGILFLDLHYQKIKGGTVTEYPELNSSGSIVSS